MIKKGLHVSNNVIVDDGVVVGYYYDVSSTDRVPEMFDALLVITHPVKSGYIYTVSVSPEGSELISPDTNTSGFTRKLIGALGFEDGWSGRLWRGFHDSNRDGVYDSSGRLLYNDAVEPDKGIFMEYTRPLIDKLVWLIHNFGVISGKRTLVRRLSRKISQHREYAFTPTGGKYVEIRRRILPIATYRKIKEPNKRQRSQRTK